MNDYKYDDDEGLIKKLLKKIFRLENTMKEFADDKSWIKDYDNYNSIWGRQSNPAEKARNALKDE